MRCIENSLRQYKQELIGVLKADLKEKIIENYKKLTPNDNVSDIEIVNDFEILLKDAQGRELLISNQSSGQRQILATAIFWAIKEVSRSNMPLIIDTPLGRLDANNRKNIIQNYYRNASHQVIVLPHSREMGDREYEYVKPYLAGFYQIKNLESRDQAVIKPCDADEIETILNGRIHG